MSVRVEWKPVLMLFVLMFFATEFKIKKTIFPEDEKSSGFLSLYFAMDIDEIKASWYNTIVYIATIPLSRLADKRQKGAPMTANKKIKILAVVGSTASNSNSS